MPALGGNKGKKNTNIQDNDDFDTKNKFEFPGIQRKDSIEEKKEEEIKAHKRKINTTNVSSWQGNKAVLEEYKEDVEVFPTLGGKKGK